MTGRVCVTGASGFIASHLVRRLLAEGQQVQGTVRDPARAGFLYHLPGAERLTLFPADLSQPDTFPPAVEGCEVVYHVAGPIDLEPEDAFRQLVEPAVTGTLGVLEAARCAGTVRRVIITSSVAALGEPHAGTVRAGSWNTRASLRTEPYAFSKSLAEQAAWRFVAEQRPDFDLAAVLPVVVLGPALGPRLSESARLITELYGGRFPAIVDLTPAIVDVRDLAQVHLQAARTNHPGRFIAWAGNISARRLVTLARRTHDHPRLPRIGLDHRPGTALVRLLAFTQPRPVRDFVRRHLGRTPRYDDSRTRTELGVTYRPLEETIRDTIHSLAAGGHLG